MLSRDTALFGTLRWAYQPVKHSVRIAKEHAANVRRRQILTDYLKGDGFKGLHVGCGTFPFKDWLNTDLLGTPNIDFPLDIEKKFPLPSSVFDAVYSSEVIEHIAREKVAPLMAETFRVLKPGGVMRLTTPDVYACCQLLLGTHPTASIEDLRASWLEGQFTPVVWFNYYMRAWGHQWIWDFDSLADTVRAAGFSDVVRVEEQVTKSRYPELNNRETRHGIPTPAGRWGPTMMLEATKPSPHHASLSVVK